MWRSRRRFVGRDENRCENQVLNGVRLSCVAMEWPEIWDVEEGAVMLETDDNTQKPFVFGFSALSSKFL
jgi:hypothetical protein